MSTVGQEAIAFVFARGGSKGLPKKNLRMLGGRPLIAWAIGTGLACRRVGRVVVSTDDQEIAATAREYGAEVPFMRPAELARDDSPEWLAWQHAIRALSVEGRFPAELMVVLPATAPLRSVRDVEACIDLAQHQPDTDLVLTMTVASRSPFFNMVVREADGCVRPVVRLEKPVFRRQDVPQAFDVTTVAYVARPDYVMRSHSLFEGRVQGVEVPTVRAVDIDHLLDLEWAEFLLRRGHPDLMP